MVTKKSLLAILLISILGISACAQRGVQNTREAKLMPEPVAKKVLTKYFGSTWVEAPSALAVHQGFCPGTYPLPYSSIVEFAVPNQGEHKNRRLSVKNWHLGITSMTPIAIMPCGRVASHAVQLNAPISEDEINDIADALVSLGARIPEILRSE